MTRAHACVVLTKRRFAYHGSLGLLTSLAVGPPAPSLSFSYPSAAAGSLRTGRQAAMEPAAGPSKLNSEEAAAASSRLGTAFGPVFDPQIPRVNALCTSPHYIGAPKPQMASAKSMKNGSRRGLGVKPRDARARARIGREAPREAPRSAVNGGSGG